MSKIAFVRINKKVANKVTTYIEDLKADFIFKKFYLEIERLGDVYLIGGSVRNISIGIPPKDLDLIIDTSKYNLRTALKKYQYTTNKFGGYKLKIGSVEIDIWNMESHWVFRRGLLKPNIINVAKGALINIDSAVINLTKNKLFSKYYNQGVKRNIYQIDFLTKRTDLINGNQFLFNQVEKAIKLGERFQIVSSKNLSDYVCKSNKVNQSIHHIRSIR